MRVIIVGLGDIGHELAVELMHENHGHELVLIDLDGERCDKLAEELDALVLQGDGTHPELLEKAQIEEADALVATTDSDALNTVVGMLAHGYGVERIVIKLVDLALRPAARQFGVRIVAPTIAAAGEIRAALSGRQRLDLSLLARGGLRVVEVDVGDEQLGQRLGEIEIPDRASVVAVVCGEKVLLPKPDVRLERPAVLVCLVENEQVLEALREALH